MVARHGGLPGGVHRGLRGAEGWKGARGTVCVGSCINTLSIWNTNRCGVEVKETERAVWFGFALALPVTKETERALETLGDVGGRTWGKTWKVVARPRHDAKRRGNLRFTTTRRAFNCPLPLHSDFCRLLFRRLVSVPQLLHYHIILRGLSYYLYNTNYRWN